METVAYVLALLMVVSLPPAFLYWFLIHPFARFWRKAGAPATYLVITPVCLACVWLIWQWREPLLAARYGLRWPLVAVGAVLYAAAIVLEIKRGRHLTFRILTGVPEVSARSGPGKLLNEGIYAKIRHPRYAALVLGIAAWACFVNYLATWVLLAATLPTVWLLVVLEERELVERFGEAYEEYRRQVPRFIPRRS